ncbi:hypothetical protein Tco_1360975 [Tanacetum coccineum]
MGFGPLQPTGLAWVEERGVGILIGHDECLMSTGMGVFGILWYPHAYAPGMKTPFPVTVLFESLKLIVIRVLRLKPYIRQNTLRFSFSSLIRIPECGKWERKKDKQWTLSYWWPTKVAEVGMDFLFLTCLVPKSRHEYGLPPFDRNVRVSSSHSGLEVARIEDMLLSTCCGTIEALVMGGKNVRSPVIWTELGESSAFRPEIVLRVKHSKDLFTN